MQNYGSEEGSEHTEWNHGQHATERRYAVIAGYNFPPRRVTCNVVDGLVLLEGDIVIGTVDEVERSLKALPQDRNLEDGFFEPADLARAVVITGFGYRWPNREVPYVINSDLQQPGRVTDAIEHWREVTPMIFTERTPANAQQYPDFVEFIPGSGCSAKVGMQGGQQFVNLADDCHEGNVKHEIGHVVGLWHEQSREDRDSFVTINEENIQAGQEFNFDQHITDGDDFGAYDYGSIMHYDEKAWSANGMNTITPNQPGVSIGQRDALSQGDIDAVCALYLPIIPVPFVRYLRPELAGSRVRKAGLVPKFTGDPSGVNTFVSSQSPTHNHSLRFKETVTINVTKGEVP